MFSRRDATELEENPGLNDTLWVSDGAFLYAVFRYLPLVHKYDANLRLVKSFQLENARLAQLEEQVLGYDRARFSTPPMLFRDVKHGAGDLYLLAPRTLFRIAADSGEIRSVYTFYGTGEDFRNTSKPEAELNYQTFALLDDGQLLLGPGWLFNHDLWTTYVPDFPVGRGSGSP